MSRRYFYTDPLAAAWMAKNFSMSFHDGALEEILWPWDYLYEKKVDGNHAVFHIHPDSLHLLQLQLGDVCRVPESCYLFQWQKAPIGGEFTCRAVAHHEDDELKVRCFVTDEAFPTPLTQIIQRDGIAFMWPESEAV